jgi:hypothetical protein
MTKETVKRYVVSSIITFLSAFGLVLLADIDAISVDSFTDGTIAGLFFVGARAGVKALLELWLSRDK